MSENDFISLNSINSRKKEEDIEINDAEFEKMLQEKGKEVYQIQPKDNEDKVLIIKVGVVINLTDILINKFDFKQKYHCLLVSSIYDLEKLKLDEELCKFNIIKIIIMLKKGKVLKPLANLSYNFNCNIHKDNNCSIQNYLSDYDNLITIEGSFSVNLQFISSGKNKIINLQIYKKHSDKDKMIEYLMKWLLDENVQNILENISKEV